MTEPKYTINQNKYCNNIVLSEKSIIVCKDKNGDTDDSMAELVCRLLNENENRVKIDSELKKELINYLMRTVTQDKKALEVNLHDIELMKLREEEYAKHFSDRIKVYENSIKAIEQMESEE